MIDSLPELYELETLEQLRALSDELRQRILGLVGRAPYTVTQVAEQLGMAPAKIHYHVRELQRVGLVRLVETREKGGILEKYYRTVAKSMTVPPSLIQSLAPDEAVAAVSALLQDVSQGFMRALNHAAASPESVINNIGISRGHLWLTDPEYRAVVRAIDDALEQYRLPRGVAGERERTQVVLMYDTTTAAALDESVGDPVMPAAPSEPATVSPHAVPGLSPLPASPPSSAPPPALASSPSSDSPPRRRCQIVAGATSWDRRALEELLERGETIDITVVGYQSFADDITPDLIDRAVARFRHHGILRASPAVREVLKRKESIA